MNSYLIVSRLSEELALPHVTKVNMLVNSYLIVSRLSEELALPHITKVTC